MTDTPTPTLDVLERAGWNNAELIWEQIQEAAAEAQAAGERQEASELWVGALEVAREVGLETVGAGHRPGEPVAPGDQLGTERGLAGLLGRRGY